MIYVLAAFSWLSLGVFTSVWAAYRQFYLTLSQFIVYLVLGPITFVGVLSDVLEYLGGKMTDLYDKLDTIYIWKKKEKNDTSTRKRSTGL